MYVLLNVRIGVEAEFVEVSPLLCRDRALTILLMGGGLNRMSELRMCLYVCICVYVYMCVYNGAVVESGGRWRAVCGRRRAVPPRICRGSEHFNPRTLPNMFKYI